MMQTCPKCGFVQPADKYCANCGLDIETYVPAPEPMLQKLGKNTKLHSAIVIVVMISLGGFVYISQKEALDQRLRDSLRRAKFMSTQMISPAPPPPQALPSPPPTQAELPKEQSAASGAAGAEKEAAKRGAEDLVVTFAEVPKTLLQKLALEGQILNESRQVRTFISHNIDSVEKLKDQEPDIKILPGGQNHALRVGLAIPFEFTHLNLRSEEIGLSFELNPLNMVNGTLEITMSGLLNLKGDGGVSIANQDLNSNYQFPVKGTLVMVGLLPRRPVQLEDQESFSNTPLAIYESVQFLNGVTDFAIFIQPR